MLQRSFVRKRKTGITLNKIFEIKFGSHLYGTSTPNSDLDLKGIYLPTARDIVLNNVKETISIHRAKAEGERNTKDDIDIEMFSLDRFLDLLCQGQTVALDMLFAPPETYTFTDPKLMHIWQEIKDNRSEFLSSNVNAFVGYARQQAAKYGIKGSRMDALKKTLDLLDQLPPNTPLINHHPILTELVEESSALVSLEKEPLIEIIHIKGPNGKSEAHLHVAGRKVPFHALVKYAKEVFGKIYKGYGDRAFKAQLAGGKDYKALSHAVRVNSEALELLQTGKITFPRPDADLLLKIKKVEMPYEQIADIIEIGLVMLLEAQEKSTLRPEPNRELAKDIVYRAYKKIVQESN